MPRYPLGNPTGRRAVDAHTHRVRTVINHEASGRIVALYVAIEIKRAVFPQVKGATPTKTPAGRTPVQRHDTLSDVVVLKPATSFQRSLNLLTIEPLIPSIDTSLRRKDERDSVERMPSAKRGHCVTNN